MKILIAAAQGVTARAATPLAIPLVQIQGKRIGRRLERNDDSHFFHALSFIHCMCVCVFFVQWTLLTKMSIQKTKKFQKYYFCKIKLHYHIEMGERYCLRFNEKYVHDQLHSV